MITVLLNGQQKIHVHTWVFSLAQRHRVKQCLINNKCQIHMK